jgi:hypothetical protein
LEEKENPCDKQHPSARPAPKASEKAPPVTITAILAVIGGITLILTAAVRIPAALAEFLRACILVAAAVRELRAALAKGAPCDDSALAELSSAEDCGH